MSWRAVNALKGAEVVFQRAEAKHFAALAQATTSDEILSLKKKRAHRHVLRAIRNKVLVPADQCEACGASSGCRDGRALSAHHHNGYEDEHILDVIWLCGACHIYVHPARGPKHHKEATRQKIGAGVRDADATGRRRKARLFGEQNGFFGRKHSDETRRKLSQPRKNPPKPLQCPVCDKMVYPAWLYRHGCEVPRVSS